MQIEEKFTGGQGPSTDAQGGEKEKDSKRELSKKPGAKLTPIAKQERVNPHAQQQYEPYTYKNYSLNKTFKGKFLYKRPPDGHPFDRAAPA